jgi:predicted phage replisome organizer
MPEGDAIVVTWFQILCLAGETNDNGLIYITRTVPYTEETLATAFDTPLSVVRLSLETFERLEMIHVYNSFLCVSNWEKYQNVDGLEKIREQTRIRVARYKQKQKELTQGNVTVTLAVTHGNATDIEGDKEIDKEEDSIRTATPKQKLKRFVPPAIEEIKEYCLQRHNNVDAQKFFDYFDAGHWIDSEGKPVKNWKQKIITWENKGSGSKQAQPTRHKSFSELAAEMDGENT